METKKLNFEELQKIEGGMKSTTTIVYCDCIYIHWGG